jgi:hypothetical protein
MNILLRVGKMSELKTVEYTHNQKQSWDEFITNSKNGNFLFYRDYVEYHSDRFTDNSLMFYEKDNLVAVMPANIKDKTLIGYIYGISTNLSVIPH